MAKNMVSPIHKDLFNSLTALIRKLRLMAYRIRPREDLIERRKEGFIINFRLILPKYWRFAFSKRVILGLLYGRLVVALILLGMPANTQAGIFSFVDHILGSPARASSDVVDQSSNSQKMALLQPALNSNPTPSMKGTELAVVGDALLSESTPDGSRVSDTSNASSDQISLYTVRSGDSLSGIAKLFNVSPNTILWANNLRSSSSIKPGDVLVILPVSGVKYTVKSGDTIQSIAKAFNGDANEIITFNNLGKEKLVAGDEIIIPDGEAGTNNSSSQTANSKSSPIQSLITKTVNTVTNVVSTGPYTDPTGYFRRPLDGGRRTQGLHGHNGVDWAAPIGTPIHAAAAGTVIISKSGGWDGGYGTYVVISHSNGKQTLYAHMKSAAVSAGSQVDKGEVIGYIGMTGQTSGPHVHFEVRGGKNPF